MTLSTGKSDPHHGHVAHSISEPCVPQCPLYQRERFMQEIYACARCGWWGADPKSNEWAGEICHRQNCDGPMKRGTFILVESGP